jgi:hypothetical protein
MIRLSMLTKGNANADLVADSQTARQACCVAVHTAWVPGSVQNSIMSSPVMNVAACPATVNVAVAVLVA